MAFNFPHIDADATLDRLCEATGISEWCRQRQVNRRTLYNVLRRERGMRRDARECRRIVTLLREEGLLVEVVSHEASVAPKQLAEN